MTNWRIGMPKDIPRQTNTFDCGVFTCLFAKYLTQKKKFDFNQDDMPNYRAEIEREIRKENEKIEEEKKKIEKENYHSSMLYNIVLDVVPKEKLEAKNSALSVPVPQHSQDPLIENLTLKASSKKRKFNSSDAYSPKKRKIVGSNNTHAASANPTTGGDIQPNIIEASSTFEPRVSPNSAPLDNKSNRKDSNRSVKRNARQKSLPVASSYKQCEGIMRDLLSLKHWKYAGPFYKPVDAKALGLVDYHEIIKNPMDLGFYKKNTYADDSLQEISESSSTIVSNTIVLATMWL